MQNLKDIKKKSLNCMPVPVACLVTTWFIAEYSACFKVDFRPCNHTDDDQIVWRYFSIIIFIFIVFIMFIIVCNCTYVNCQCIGSAVLKILTFCSLWSVEAIGEVNNSTIMYILSMFFAIGICFCTFGCYDLFLGQCDLYIVFNNCSILHKDFSVVVLKL